MVAVTRWLCICLRAHHMFGLYSPKLILFHHWFVHVRVRAKCSGRWPGSGRRLLLQTRRLWPCNSGSMRERMHGSGQRCRQQADDDLHQRL